MTKREQRMFFSIVVLLLVLGHVWLGNVYFTTLEKKKNEVLELNTKAGNYRHSAGIQLQIHDEMEWVAQYEPEAQSFGDAETALLDFLQTSGKQCGVETESPKFLRQNTKVGKYRKARVQISTLAAEAEIYKWIASIHCPTELRAVTQLTLRPDAKESEKVHCSLVAEKWLIEQGDDNG